MSRVFSAVQVVTELHEPPSLPSYIYRIALDLLVLAGNKGTEFLVGPYII